MEVPTPLSKISEELMTPCYVDLMPIVSSSDELSEILRVDADNYLKHAQCYRRQYELIQEVKAREKDN